MKTPHRRLSLVSHYVAILLSKKKYLSTRSVGCYTSADVMLSRSMIREVDLRYTYVKKGRNASRWPMYVSNHGFSATLDFNLEQGQLSDKICLLFWLQILQG